MAIKKKMAGKRKKTVKKSKPKVKKKSKIIKKVKRVWLKRSYTSQSKKIDLRISIIERG